MAAVWKALAIGSPRQITWNVKSIILFPLQRIVGKEESQACQGEVICSAIVSQLRFGHDTIDEYNLIAVTILRYMTESPQAF